MPTAALHWDLCHPPRQRPRAGQRTIRRNATLVLHDRTHFCHDVHRLAPHLAGAGERCGPRGRVGGPCPSPREVSQNCLMRVDHAATDGRRPASRSE